MNSRQATILICTILFLRNPAIPLDDNGRDVDIRSWSTISTRHFDVHYPAGMEAMAIRASEIAESGYIRIANRLGHELTGIIPVAIYPAGCNHTGDLSRDSHYPGSAMTGKGIAVSFCGSYTDLQRSIVTAMSRSFLYSVAGESPFHYAALRTGRLPHWLSEGMARYLACGFDGRADLALREVIEGNRFLGIRDMNGLKTVRTDDAAAEGQAFCYYIETTYGTTALGELARDFFDTSFPDDAFRAATGKTVEDLEREWASSLKKRYRRDPWPKNPEKITAPASPSARITIPAVSPDGKRIAALRTVNGRSDLLIFDAPAGRIGTGKRPRILLRGGSCGGVTPVAPGDNRISWCPDGRTMMLAAMRKGRPCLLFLDTSSGRIIDSRPVPFSLVRDPALSPDGRRVAFSAVAGTAENIYVLDRDRNTVSRITDDDFSDRYPVFTADGGGIVFSTNWNTRGNPSSGGSRIHRIDIGTGRRTILAVPGENNIQGDVSPDGKKLLLITEGSGMRGVCVYDFAAGTLSRLKNQPARVANPRWLKGSSSFIFTAPGAGGADIAEESVSATLPYDPKAHDQDLSPALYGEPYVDPQEYLLQQYQPAIKPGYLKLGSAGTMDSGYICHLRAGLNDYMERHRLVLDAGYVREPRRNDFNASLGYYLKIPSAVLGFCFFRRSSPLDAGSLEPVSGLSMHPSFGLRGMEHYGGHVSARVKIGRSFDITFSGSSGRYEKTYHYPDMTHDLRMTFGKLSFTAECNTERKGPMAPLSGSRLLVMAEHAFDITGNNHYTVLGIDFRRHFLLDRRFILLLRGAGAALAGSNNGNFRYFLGGFGSLRGYGINSISGRNMVLFNAELRFTPSDWNSFGVPSGGGLGNVAFVLFFDAGSAWNGTYRFLDKKTGRLDDLKMDFGAGLRMAVSPLLILKLDFAWPFDNKSIRQTNMILSIGFDF